MTTDPAVALLLFLLLCSLLLVGPFCPAWLEWQHPTDRLALRPAPPADPAPDIRSDRAVTLARHTHFRTIEAPVIVFGQQRTAPSDTATSSISPASRTSVPTLIPSTERNEAFRS